MRAFGDQHDRARIAPRLERGADRRMPHNSPCAPALGDIATADMPVSVNSQCANWSISSSAPWTLSCGLSG